MSEALYSKYRPKIFDDVVGQKSILQTLKNAIKANKISHAYMFCGTRGTGKTTMARILAKACMCQNPKDGHLPSTEMCGVCQNCKDIASGQHPDVYELDAASRTGVENVREEIISRVGFAATRGNKKIYIIDEVHMLSTAAFNALLKTLEEPPEHVIFVLCTTDPQKVPDTILSRCQRFDFTAISVDDIIARLQYVCKQEAVSAEEGALKIIAHNAQGAMRNALTGLELAIAYTDGNITEASVKQSMNNSSSLNYEELLEAIVMRNLPAVFTWVDEVCGKGVDFSHICNELTQIVRDMYVKISGASKAVHLDENIDSLLGFYTAERLHRFMLVLSDMAKEMRINTNLRLCFELAMAKMCRPKCDLSLEALDERIAELEKGYVSTAVNCKSVQNFEDKKSSTEKDLASPVPAKKKPVLNTQFYNADAGLENAQQEKNNNQASADARVDQVVEKPPASLNIPQVEPVQEKSQPSLRIPEVKQGAEEQKSSLKIPEIDYASQINQGQIHASQNVQGANIPPSTSPELTAPNLKIPEKNESVDFGKEREDLRAKVGYNEPVQEEIDLNKKEDLQKFWHQAFSVIRKKYPAFGAILLLSNIDYDAQSKQIVLAFPKSSEFSVNVLNKPDNRKKIQDVVAGVLGKDIEIDIKLDNADANNKFDPQFVNEFRDNKVPVEKENDYEPESFYANNDAGYTASNFSDAPLSEVAEPEFIKNREEKLQERDANRAPSSSEDIKSMLENLGAFNISEE